MREAAVIGLVASAGSTAVVGWTLRFLLPLVVRSQTPLSGVWYGGEVADPMFLGEVTDTSTPGLGSSAANSRKSFPSSRPTGLVTQGQ